MTLRLPRRRFHPKTLALLQRVVASPEAVLDGAGVREVVIVDTETSEAGRGARLVELAALCVRDGAVVEEFQTLVNPESHISGFVTSIHHITDAMVARAPTVGPALRAFLAFAGARPLVAHNAPFDRGVLSRELLRAELPRPAVPMYCTLKLARRVFPDAPNHRLETLARWLKVPAMPSHRALADCRATLGVFNAVTARHPKGAWVTVHGAAKTL
ncbi:MAG: 3'-5' exonuclease [Deltaproteobacteria bacterium]|nr:3'-5' exonuclease [Deltaproteobacteria bacterium]